MVDFLLAKGANINHANEAGETVFNIACRLRWKPGVTDLLRPKRVKNTKSSESASIDLSTA